MAERPTLLTIIGALVAIESAVAALAGLLLIVAAGLVTGAITQALEQAGMGSMAAAIAGMLGIFGVLMIVAGAVGIFVALQLLKGKSWARILVTVGAVLNLTAVPVGTIIGLIYIYILWVDKSVKEYFEAAK
ncbi:Uncharacterised protein [Candidatus Gugararchaeum adminiculabundum]|nr:Uncharacterised protein [Candidatus Gugararchaeum adminiculabundum]